MRGDTWNSPEGLQCLQACRDCISVATCLDGEPERIIFQNARTALAHLWKLWGHCTKACVMVQEFLVEAHFKPLYLRECFSRSCGIWFFRNLWRIWIIPSQSTKHFTQFHRALPPPLPQIVSSRHTWTCPNVLLSCNESEHETGLKQIVIGFLIDSHLLPPWRSWNKPHLAFACLFFPSLRALQPQQAALVCVQDGGMTLTTEHLTG